MTDKEQKKIFAKNLNYFLNLNDKTQKEVAEYLGIGLSTFNSWCTATKLPRMGTVQTLADYFGILKSDLIDDKSQKQEENYYLNEDARKLCQFMFDNPDYKVLFDAAKDVKVEDIEFVRQLIQKMKK